MNWYLIQLSKKKPLLLMIIHLSPTRVEVSFVNQIIFIVKQRLALIKVITEYSARETDGDLELIRVIVLVVNLLKTQANELTINLLVLSSVKMLQKLRLRPDELFNRLSAIEAELNFFKGLNKKFYKS